MTDNGIEVDGQIEKLERIRYALSFVRDEFIEGCDERTKQDIAIMKERIRKWQSVMRRSRTGNQIRREEHAENPPDIGGVSVLMEDRATSKMEAIVARAVEGHIVSNTEINMVAYYMMAVMLFTNSQRPSAVQNLTLNKYQNRKQITEDGKTYTIYKVRSCEHLRM